MGEIADDITDGCCCGQCGVYFEDAHGYPVYCKNCWRHATKEEKKGYQKAHLKEIS